MNKIKSFFKNLCLKIKSKPFHFASILILSIVLVFVIVVSCLGRGINSASAAVSPSCPVVDTPNMPVTPSNPGPSVPDISTPSVSVPSYDVPEVASPTPSPVDGSTPAPSLTPFISDSLYLSSGSYWSSGISFSGIGSLGGVTGAYINFSTTLTLVYFTSSTNVSFFNALYVRYTPSTSSTSLGSLSFSSNSSGYPCITLNFNLVDSVSTIQYLVTSSSSSVSVARVYPISFSSISNNYVRFALNRASNPAYSQYYKLGWSDSGTENYLFGYRDAYKIAYQSGFSAGYGLGFDDSYVLGYDAAYQDAFDRGYTDGFNVGWTGGVYAGYDSNYNASFCDGFEYAYDGLDDYLQQQYNNGFAAGRAAGRNEALTEGLTNPVSYMLEPVVTFFDTKLFGVVSIGSVLSVVLFVAIAIIFLKMFAGG